VFGSERAKQRKLLADLSDLLAEAEKLVDRTGGPEGYLEDSAYMLAGEAIVHRLGEIAKRFPEDFQAKNPKVPWRQLMGTRNIVAHDYERVDHRILWRALSSDLPEMKKNLGRLLPEPKPVITIGPSQLVTLPPTARLAPVNRQTTCNKWMPRSRTRCGLVAGHKGHCRVR
jgi:uncharacterized protein with HEPN domain